MKNVGNTYSTETICIDNYIIHKIRKIKTIKKISSTKALVVLIVPKVSFTFHL